MKLKLIAVALRDFAVPVPRTGSIESLSGYGSAAAEGRETHARVQKKHARSDPSYEAEAAIRREFERGSYRFRIDGRMDGIFRGAEPRIEEIKTCFNVRELSARLAADPFHPYCLQLLTYGYFYRLEHGVVPALTFHLVSTRDGRSRDLVLSLDIPSYEKWLDRRLEELVVEAIRAEKRAARRRKIARHFVFPFPCPRPGQEELMQTIERALDRGVRMLMQAPTGLGKTAAVLYPVLRDALSRGQRVVYVTPKNSQHSVAEDAVNRFQEAGANVKSLTITAKSRICFKNEPLCNPDYCEFARDYYAKLHEHGLLEILAGKRKLRVRAFRDLGARYEVCPFELQIDASVEADVVICDYNYVFAPRSALGRAADPGIDQEGKPNLVIDEVHNLPSRAMDYYSPSVSAAVLEQMRESLGRLPPAFRAEAAELLDEAVGAIAVCRPATGAGPARIDPPLGPFADLDAKLRAFLSRYLDSDIEILPRDAVMRLCFYWAEFTEALAFALDPDRREFFTTFHPNGSGGEVRITCCDASALLKDRFDAYRQVVGFSATLKPFEYYAGLSGLDPASVLTAEFQSPFPKRNRKILIIPQISTRYSDRARNYGKIGDAIQKIARLRAGNYFAFFPSFEFLDRVFALFEPPEGFEVLKQERDMKTATVEQILGRLRGQAAPAVLFAVQGGMFSEGVDYPGEMAIGAFVIGPPLPNFDLVREQMRAYYERHYRAGFDYAYTIPAMARAVQAAGRVIRSETDRGLIVLMDNRFIQPAYSRCMPSDWFSAGPQELVSPGILKEVADFWNEGSSGNAEGGCPSAETP